MSNVRCVQDVHAAFGRRADATVQGDQDGSREAESYALELTAAPVEDTGSMLTHAWQHGADGRRIKGSAGARSCHRTGTVRAP